MKFGLKVEADYFYFPEFRDKEIGLIINNVLDLGHKVITTTHTYGIDAIETRVKRNKT